MLRKLRPLIVAPLAAIIALAGAPGASAEPTLDDKCGEVGSGFYCDINGQASNAVITKVLQMPVGTTVPDADFGFDVTPISVDGVLYKDLPDKSVIPNLGPGNFTLSTDPGNDKPNTDASSANGDIDTYTYKTENILPDLKDFKHAGVYMYEISEINPDANADPDPIFNRTIRDDDNQLLTYSKAVYTFTLYVNNTADGNAFYIYAITAEPKTTDTFDSASGKVDPTQESLDGMRFTSTYIKTNTSGPTDTSAPLAISNTVAGIMANTTTLYFDYLITVTPSTLDKDNVTAYTAYVVQDGVVITPTDDNLGESNLAADPVIAGITATGNQLSVSPGVLTSFRLLHNQKLVFVNTSVGTSYEVSEIDPKSQGYNYDGSLSITTDDTIGELSKASELNSGPQRVVVSPTLAAFTNNFNLASQTGLTLGSLPFVGLVAVALIALVVVVAVKYSGRKVAGANS